MLSSEFRLYIPLVGRLMSVVIGCALVITACSPDRDNGPEDSGWPEQFGFGRAASPEEIAAWDIDVRPDGQGLPEGSGNVAAGGVLYRSQCARCHGASGWGGPYMALVEHVDTSAVQNDRTEKTIGSYWPYATTLYDYIHRAMPYDSAGSLSPAEVYHITAWLLYANHIIDSTTVVTAETLPRIAMPAQPLFVPDDRSGGPEVR